MSSPTNNNMDHQSQPPLTTTGVMNSNDSNMDITASAPVVHQQNWKFKAQTPTDFNESIRRKRRNSEPGVLVQRSYKNYVTHWKLETKKPTKLQKQEQQKQEQQRQEQQRQEQLLSQMHQKQQQQQQQHFYNNSLNAIPSTSTSTSTGLVQLPNRDTKLSPQIASLPGSPHLFPSSTSAFKPINNTIPITVYPSSPKNNNNNANSNSGTESSPLSPHYMPHRKHSLGESGDQFKFHPYKLNTSSNSISDNNNCTENNNNNNNNNNIYDVDDYQPHTPSPPSQYFSPLHHQIMTPLQQGGPGHSRLSQRRVSLPIISQTKQDFSERTYYLPFSNSNSSSSSNSNSSNNSSLTFNNNNSNSNSNNSSSGDQYQLPPLRKFDLQFPSLKFSPTTIYKENNNNNNSNNSSNNSSNIDILNKSGGIQQGHDKKPKITPKIPFNNNNYSGTNNNEQQQQQQQQSFQEEEEVYNTNSNYYDSYSSPVSSFKFEKLPNSPSHSNNNNSNINTNQQNIINLTVTSNPSTPTTSNLMNHHPSSPQDSTSSSPSSSIDQESNNNNNTIAKKLPSIQSLLSDVSEVSISDPSSSSSSSSSPKFIQQHHSPNHNNNSTNSNTIKTAKMSLNYFT